MERYIPRILVGTSQEQRDYAAQLSSAISEWAKSEVWNETFEASQVTLSTVEETMPDYDVYVYLLTTEDIDRLCDGDLHSSASILLDVFLSYAFIGRRNTIVVLQRSNKAILDLLRVMNFIIYDFTKSIEGLAKEVKKRCINSELKADKRSNKGNREKISIITSGKAVDFKQTAPEEKLRDTSFLPYETSKNEGEDVIPARIIEKYQLPDLIGEEYEFALVKLGDEVFITDQGKTYKRLDQIFELSELDVIKNLVAILKQYGAIKSGNEFVMRIHDWNGNANEDENEDIKKAKLALFSCVSFMLNMKIFYV